MHSVTRVVSPWCWNIGVDICHKWCSLSDVRWYTDCQNMHNMNNIKKTHARIYFLHVVVKFVTVYISEVTGYQIRTVEFSVIRDKGGKEMVQMIKNNRFCVLCSTLKVKLLLGSSPLNKKTFFVFWDVTCHWNWCHGQHLNHWKISLNFSGSLRT